MKKPKKKTKNNHNCIGLCECETYNQACDEWEKYHEQEIKLLELFLDNTRNDLKSLKDNFESLSKAISKR